MSGLIDPARNLTLITPAASPTNAVGQKTYRAIYAEDDCTAKLLLAGGGNVTIPLLKGMNPIQFTAVFSTPDPAVDLWGVD